MGEWYEVFANRTIRFKGKISVTNLLTRYKCALNSWNNQYTGLSFNTDISFQGHLMKHYLKVSCSLLLDKNALGTIFKQ